MDALRGRIPRALKNHKTPEGWAYGQYCRGLLARLGPLPNDARPTLREAGLVVVDLIRARENLERIQKPRFREAKRRYAREILHLRHTLLLLERRLEQRMGMPTSNSNDSVEFASLLAAQAIEMRQSQRDRD